MNMSCEDCNYHFYLMPTQLKQVINSFLTWSAYEKLAMFMTWQISPGTVLLQLPYTTESALESSWVFWLLFSKDGVLESEWGLFTPPLLPTAPLS
jgi:hypothetical protein